MGRQAATLLAPDQGLVVEVMQGFVLVLIWLSNVHQNCFNALLLVIIVKLPTIKVLILDLLAVGET